VKVLMFAIPVFMATILLEVAIAWRLSLPPAIRIGAVVSAAAAAVWLFALRRERRSASATT